MRVLIAEDDQDLGSVLSEFLKLNGFEVTLAINGVEAYERFQEKAHDICVLDVMMPDMDGFSLAGLIKKHNPEVPFIFLTARSLKEDKLKGLKLGADDYITKPFDPEELVLRLENILKRSNISSKSILEFSKTVVDQDNMRITSNGESNNLTLKECELISYFFNNPNKIISREELLENIWGEDDYFLGRSMDVFISKLRKYISNDTQLQIRTVRGKGFILELV